MDDEKLYLEIYNKHDRYGYDIDRFPCSRLIPLYIDYLKSPIAYFGCGHIHAIRTLRDKFDKVDGFDINNLNYNMFQEDDTKDIDLSEYNSIICMGLIERLTDKHLHVLFDNFKKVERQVFSIHNGSCISRGIELHINRKIFTIWNLIIFNAGLEILDSIQISPEQKLYFTKLRH